MLNRFIESFSKISKAIHSIRETDGRPLHEALTHLKQNETMIRSVLFNALDAVVAMSDDGLITQWNPCAERTFGFTADEVIGKRMSEVIIPKHYRVAHEHGMQHYRASGEGPVLNKRIEISAIRKSGEEFPIELSITPIETGDTIVFYAFIRDISDRINAEKEKANLLAQLQEAVAARDAFIGIASHELKTPITSLKLQFQMAQRQIDQSDRRVFSDESVMKRVANANQQFERMTRLIDDMLDVSRVVSGKFEMSFETVNLSVLVNEAVHRFSDQLAAVGSKITLNLKPQVFIEADRYRIEQVIANLMTNALKYGSGKPVHVALNSDATGARLTVQDHGIGIAAEDLGRIFKRFERATPRNAVSGLGLGLYITQQIIEGHHGTISVVSEVNRGTAFSIALPTSIQHAL